MGILDFFKKKTRRPDGHEQAEAAPGWDAITRVFEAAYPGQTTPIHRGPVVLLTRAGLAGHLTLG